MSKKQPIVVNVTLSVLKWLIESSGWTKEEIAKRLKTSLQNIEKIESGEKKPSFRQLEELAVIFKRPVASFLLSKPLTEKPKPKDYRMLPDKTNKFDKKTVFVMRHARRLQELNKELSRNVDYETKSKIEKVKISDSSEAVALKFRNKFQLTEEKQKKIQITLRVIQLFKRYFRRHEYLSIPIFDAY